MRTTLRLDDELLAQVKAFAASRGRTLTSVMEEALRRLLVESRHADETEPVMLPVSSHGGGIQPGVDLDDSAALLDLMERSATS